MKCQVKRCRQDSVINVLGVDLCDKHFDMQSDAIQLATKKGILTRVDNAAVLLPPNYAKL